MNGWLAKVLGWGFFAIQTAGQVSTGGLPHGFGGWAQLIGALALAVGVHASSNVGAVVTMPTPNTTTIIPAGVGSTGLHVTQ